MINVLFISKNLQNSSSSQKTIEEEFQKTAEREKLRLVPYDNGNSVLVEDKYYFFNLDLGNNTDIEIREKIKAMRDSLEKKFGCLKIIAKTEV